MRCCAVRKAGIKGRGVANFDQMRRICSNILQFIDSAHIFANCACIAYFGLFI